MSLLLPEQKLPSQTGGGERRSVALLDDGDVSQ